VSSVIEPAEEMPIDLKTNVAHPARVYDYLLGGKDNFPADREHVERAIAVAPEMRSNAQANRQFLVRAVRFLAEQGIRQFIDLGTGIPTSPNVHEVAQAVAPDAHIVYVDNDPIVLVHARALMASGPQGATAYIDADLREPEAILGHLGVAELIDFDQPVGILLIATLHLVPDADDPAGIVRRLLAPAAPGSYLVISQFALDVDEQKAQAVAAAAKHDGITLVPRRHEEILRFFDGLDLLDPGLVLVPRWRPDSSAEPIPYEERVWLYAGVARKP